MSKKWRVRLILVAAVVAAALGVVFSPSAFVRGLIVGAVLGPAALIGAFALVMRRLKRRMNEGLQPPPLPTQAWDYDMRLRDLEGEVHEASVFAGEVLVLNFWATWCAPCVAEMPSLERLRKETAGMGVTFACVTQEPEEAVRKFLTKRGFDLPIYFVEGEIPEGFSSRAIPATYVLDRSGNIALRHVGAAQWDAERVVSFVKGLAATP